MKLFIGNLPFSSTEAELHDLFNNFGGVVECVIPLDRESGRPRGFAFVTLNSKEFGEEAIRALDGSDLGGRAIRVSEATAPTNRGGGGGGGGRGGYGGGGGGGGNRGGGGYGGGGGNRGGGGRDRRDKNRGRENKGGW